MSDGTQTLGKYQIIREIARSNDIVYEAYDPIMNRRVALKELSMPGGLNNVQQEDRRNRFLREARAAGTLTHPNIVTVYEYGEESGRHYIVMEFLDGHTLRNELDTHGFLPLDRALEVAKSVLSALEFAHKGGVIHRDVKPENIQLMADGHVKITDFGIARLTFEPNLTMDGQVFGTPSYMSPEQVVGREIDARSDLFSLGVVLYEMISGRKPFSGDSVVSITYAIMNAEPPQPPQANHAIWQVLQRSLDKSPALRHSGAPEMLAALEEAERASMAGPVLDPGPAMTPYGTPNYNPYGGQPQVQPQFQIGAAPPVGNPYVQTPYQAAPQSYPFNPYQSPPPTIGGPPPGFSSIPVYYPPPPRPPMFTPEAKSTLTRVFVAFLIIGTILVLAIVAVNSFSTAWARYKAEQNGHPVGAISTQPGNRTPPAANLPLPNSRTGEVSRPPAATVETGPPADVPVAPVVRNDPEAVYDPDRAKTLLTEALDMAAADPRRAREKLYEARKLAPPGSEVATMVETAIMMISEERSGG